MHEFGDNVEKAFTGHLWLCTGLGKGKGRAAEARMCKGGGKKANLGKH
jgi:hypothetical protein